MRKYILILLIFISYFGLSQTSPTYENITIRNQATIRQKAYFIPTISAPAVPLEGMLYADTDGYLYYYNGSAWVTAISQWTLTGSDIQNNNTGKVTINDSLYITDVKTADKTYWIMHWNQSTKRVEKMTPLTLYDTIREQYRDSTGIDINPPGLEWTLRTAPSNITWQSITYGNGLFVAVGFGGTTAQIMTSPDAVTWTARTTIDNDWIGVTYANGLFVSVSDDGTVTDSLLMYSPDGITWTNHYNNHQSAKNVCFGNPASSLPKWVKVNYGSLGNNVGYSLNGLDYTMQTVSVNNLFDVCFGNGKFVAVGNNDSTIYSTDGINWTGTPCTSASWTSVIYANGLFVACRNSVSANGVMTSPDGITWTDRATPTYVYSVAYGDGLFVGVGSFGHIITSPDAINWTEITGPYATAWHDVVYANGMFVAIGGPNGAGNAIMTSGAIISRTTQLNNVTNGDYTFTGRVDMSNDLTFSSGAGMASDLDMNSYNIDAADSLNVGSISFTDPTVWMDSFRKNAFYFDEFYNVNVANHDPWLGLAVTSGVLTSETSVVNHPGIVSVTGGGSANSGYRVVTPAATHVIGGSEIFEFSFTATDTTNLLLRAGFIDTFTATDQTDGIYIEINSNTTVRGKTAAATTRSTTSTGYVITQGTWYRAKIVVNSDATRVDFTLYSDAGAVLWTNNLTTNIPTDPTGTGFVTLETDAVGAEFIWIDYMSMYLGTLVR